MDFLSIYPAGFASRDGDFLAKSADIQSQINSDLIDYIRADFQSVNKSRGFRNKLESFLHCRHILYISIETNIDSVFNKHQTFNR
jgi:hypothetical protein